MTNGQRVFLWILTWLLGVAAFTSPPVLAADQVQVAVNGQYVSFPDAPPFVDARTNRLMVPARFVAEELGFGVQWDEKVNQVTLANKDDVMKLTIGQRRVQVNGKSAALDAPAVIKNNRMMVPLRFISEAAGAQIDWIAARNLAVVTTPGQAKAAPPVSPVAADDAQAGGLGTWIWDAALIQTEPEKVVTFASDHQLTAIYLQIDKHLPVSAYQSFVRRAKEKQIKVEALAGRPEWAHSSQQQQIRDFLSWVKAYHAAAKPEERFEGLHFDIEPYLLAEWKTNQRRVIENWMDSIRLIERETTGSGLSLTLDVPFWLHLVKVPDTDYSLSAWLLEKADSIVIMDYRNTALGNDGIVANARAILREAATLKKQVAVAVETYPSSEGPLTSFHSLGIEAMQRELQIAREQLSHYSSYAGFAVHDYQRWSELEERPK